MTALLPLVRPRLLDLFCGGGGASRGYHDAGFEVVGIDLADQPNYPFEFHRADALSVLGSLVTGTTALEPFDAIHASPPCQGYSKALKHLSGPQPLLIEDVKALLNSTGLPWIIENVEGAPLASQHTVCGRFGAMFCGTAFGLRVQRHRLFEANWPIKGTFCSHDDRPLINPYNKKARERLFAEFPNTDNVPDWAEVVWRREMGIEWMGRYDGREAIPPVYTESIGGQLLSQFALVEEAA